MSGPDLAQRRAHAALKAIKIYQQDKIVDGGAYYASYVKSVPAAILMNGLGQALATEYAQGGKDTDRGQGGGSPDAHKQIYLHVEAWLCGDDPDAVFPKAQEGGPKLLNCLCTASQADYLRAQEEALLYLGWLKKFAVAFLDSSDKAEGVHD